MKRLLIAILNVAPSLHAWPTAAEPALAAEPLAVADPPSSIPAAEAPAVALVRHALLEPLAAKEEDRSKFSRARLAPQERRVRLIDQPHRDARGLAFVRFAIDERRGLLDDDSWEMATITGCVYLVRKQVFVDKGDRVRPVEFLLGKYRKAAPAATCRGDAPVARGD
jgi:hypothetical protein